MELWSRRSNKTRVTGSEKSTFDHPLLGEVVLNQSARATRISIAISREGTIKLTVPYGIDTNKGIEFLDSKLEWIAAAQAKAQAQSRNNQAIKVLEPPLSTKFRQLRLLPQPNQETAKATITTTEIIVSYPESKDHKDPEIQHLITLALEKACRQEAAYYLPRRVAQLAAYAKNIEPRYSWNFGQVSVRKARTRWGSCASDNNISLNISLMLLPDRLIDFVILHELTHTVHKDHSARFYALLDKLLHGNQKALRTELKGFSPLGLLSSHRQ